MSATLYASSTPTAEKTLWRTPPALVAAVVARFGPLHVDASASPGMAIGGVLAQITPAADALAPRSWSSYAPIRRPAIWLNPPWAGGGITKQWAARALTEVDRGCSRLFVLVPEATDSAWWWTLAARSLVVYSLGRVGYMRPGGEIAARPGHGSSLFYLLPGGSAEAQAALVPWRDWQTAAPARPRFSVVRS